MEAASNATRLRGVTLPADSRLAGLLLGSLGVLAFSFTMPATKLALPALDPWFLASGRAVVAAILAAVVLRVTRAPRPARGDWRRLAIVAAGVVLGFPLFSSLALETGGAAHAAVIAGVLPAMTAVAAVARAGERPGLSFWIAALTGLVVVTGFALMQSGGAPTASDAFMLAAVVLCALGYAEGGALARTLGGAHTICWALVLALPAMLPVAILAAPHAPPDAVSILGFAYISAISMFLGFFAWYGGLARGGVARVGQVQLAQPLLTIGWSALVLAEAVDPWTLLAAGGVLISVAASQRARVSG